MESVQRTGCEGLALYGFALQAVLPENRTNRTKPYNPLLHKALGLYGFLYVYGMELK
ncbi:hypothetical protein [uncultured Phascolarctobacterium sp.]|uniref:hypothetical protein n=1 Tax=uncultured Phascolarctobacterium sp. TaxID=512296 RepID=UPI0025FB05E0|nr:hypothetical protein [uncultured Phascolarctobacterium sp.]